MNRIGIRGPKSDRTEQSTTNRRIRKQRPWIIQIAGAGSATVGRPGLMVPQSLRMADRWYQPVRKSPAHPGQRCPCSPAMAVRHQLRHGGPWFADVNVSVRFSRSRVPSSRRGCVIGPSRSPHIISAYWPGANRHDSGLTTSAALASLQTKKAGLKQAGFTLLSFRRWA